MSIRKPPLPMADWKDWAMQVFRYLSEEQAGPTPRKAVLLSSLTSKSNPSQDGILLWDSVNKRVVVSRDGEWRPLQEEP